MPDPQPSPQPMIVATLEWMGSMHGAMGVLDTPLYFDLCLDEYTLAPLPPVHVYVVNWAANCSAALPWLNAGA